MNKYSDYLEVVDFPSEINEHSVKDPSFRWQDTFPHKTFIDLLKAAERMLGRATSSDRKSIWIEGAYGTGKSRIAWALKTLLECSGEELKEYFNEYDDLRRETDLRDRLLGHKRGKIVTVYRYGSSEINNIRDLTMAIYEETSKALKRAKLEFCGADTLRGSILKWLELPANQEYLAALIRMPENQMLGSLAGKSIEGIIEQLKNPNCTVQSLVQDLQKLGDAHGITMFSRTMDDLKEWLKKVISENGLKAIVFVWDEFSEFFRKNQNEMAGLQKLVELTSEQPFYMVIVTHDSMFTETDKEGKKIRDRFISSKIELPDSIAFDLIGHVIHVRSALQDEWSAILNGGKDCYGLKDMMIESCKKVAEIVWKDPKKGKDTLARMLPLHPMAALLLKYISENFASNQRSMFNFIKNTNDEEAFQWFINNHYPDNEDILTIDHLWNFFYEKGTEDHGSGMGRSNLDTRIRMILDTYMMKHEGLDREEKRVLKTVLMMQAINEKMGNQLSLFQATEENLKLAFEGCGQLADRPVNIAKALVNRNILFRKELGKGVFVFAASAMSADQEKVDKEKKKKMETSTAELAQLGKFEEEFKNRLTLSQRCRYTVTVVTSQNFTQKINALSNPPSKDTPEYRIPAVLAVARTRDERSSLTKAIQGALGDERYRSLVFIDASDSRLLDEKFEEWARYCAEAVNLRSIDRKSADNNDRLAGEILTNWRKEIENGIFKVYSFEDPSGQNCQCIADVTNALAWIVVKRFPLSLDSVPMTEAMWGVCSSVPKKVVDLGIRRNSGGIVSVKVVEWVRGNETDLEKLQQKVDALLEEGFQKVGRVEISDIFGLLIQNGFMPCNFYAYLTGYLLRNCADSKYRCTDGESSSQMTEEKLAEIVAENIKHHFQPSNRYKEKSIEVLSPEQAAFIRFAKNVWNIDGRSIESVTRQLCSKLKTLQFPIWCLKELDRPNCTQFLELLAGFANSNNSKDQSSTAEIASKLGRLLNEKPELEKTAAELLTAENARKGMKAFLTHFEGGRILELANKLRVPDVLRDVQELFRNEALWLWDQGVGEDEIRKLLTSYRIMELSSRFLGTTPNSLTECFKEWREKLRTLKIPCAILMSERAELKVFLGFLKEIALHGKLSYESEQKFMTQLETHADALEELFANRVQIFRQVYDLHLQQLDDESIHKIYANIGHDLFLKERNEADTQVEYHAEKVQHEQASSNMRRLWKDLTGTDTPYAWSQKYRTPIVIMVPEEEREKTKRIFDILNRKNHDSQELQDVLDFLNAPPKFMEVLTDQTQIDAAFQKYIVGKYQLLLQDPNEVRDYLSGKLTVYCYAWFDSDSVRRAVETLARKKYDNSGCARVQERFADFSEAQIRSLLNWVVQNSVDAGIRILTEYEG
ncbi:MAG: hypothetical protein IJD43_08600 [Thermoguttaceae bacterium]|nr:hypothetical protein [Thermoguttaceae bacterium]